MAKITFETDDHSEARKLLDALETREAPVAETKAAPAPVVEPVVAETKGDDELDSNGMPWDGDIHTEKRTQNADGSWKARKGKADEAKAAVAAHKAAGGNVEPPATTGMPTGAAPAATGMPTGMPKGVAATIERAPVTQAHIEEKILGMLSRGTLLNDYRAEIGEAPSNSYQGVLDHHGVNRDDPEAATSTNESLRAAMMETLLQIEPASYHA